MERGNLGGAGDGVDGPLDFGCRVQVGELAHGERERLDRAGKDGAGDFQDDFAGGLWGEQVFGLHDSVLELSFGDSNFWTIADQEDELEAFGMFEGVE